MMSQLRNLWQKEQFDPGFIGLLVNPFFLARRSLWRAIRDAAPHVSGRVLDVGCGTMPYRALFVTPTYVGLDIDSPSTRARGVAHLLYDGGKFPVQDCEFDAALCNQVLEHVFEPDTFLAEVHRSLKPGGRLLLTVPFVWDEHEQPFDFARYTSFGLAALLNRHGFELVRHRKLMADFSILPQLFNAYVYKIVQAWPTWARLCVCALVMSPASLAGLALGRILPRNEDLFLDQLVLARKV
jgi:SAM-dependent methyltransferase